MANTKVTKAVLADDAVGLAQLDISNDPSDGQALTYDGNSTNLQWATVGVSGIDSSADATAITIDSSERVAIGSSTANKIFNIADPNQGGETLKLHFEAFSSDDKWAIYSYDRTNSHVADLSFGSNYMYLKSGGNVGIGTTSPSQKLSVTSGDNTSSTNIARFAANNDTLAIGIGYESIRQTETGGVIKFETNGSERMTIHSNGSVSIGTSTSIGTLGVIQGGASATTFALYDNSSNRKWFYLPNGYYGYQGSETIYANGGVNRYFANASGTGVGSIVVNSGSTAFNTTSDYRLKDNPQTLTGSGEFIDALQPKTWTWNHGDGGTGVGFIAHEAAEVGLGLCVTGEKDATRIDKVLNEETGEHEEQTVPSYQQLDYSSGELIGNIVAELQALRTRVATLETELDAAEARIETLESN